MMHDAGGIDVPAAPAAAGPRSSGGADVRRGLEQPRQAQGKT